MMPVPNLLPSPAPASPSHSPLLRGGTSGWQWLGVVMLRTTAAAGARRWNSLGGGRGGVGGFCACCVYVCARKSRTDPPPSLLALLPPLDSSPPLPSLRLFSVRAPTSLFDLLSHGLEGAGAEWAPHTRCCTRSLFFLVASSLRPPSPPPPSPPLRPPARGVLARPPAFSLTLSLFFEGGARTKGKTRIAVTGLSSPSRVPSSPSFPAFRGWASKKASARVHTPIEKLWANNTNERFQSLIANRASVPPPLFPPSPPLGRTSGGLACPCE